MYIYCFIIDLEYVVKMWIPKLYLGFELKPKYETIKWEKGWKNIKYKEDRYEQKYPLYASKLFIFMRLTFTVDFQSKFEIQSTRFEICNKMGISIWIWDLKNGKEARNTINYKMNL
jgi:hypothetical protein